MTNREIMQQALDMIDKLTWALETHLYIKAPSDAKPLMDALRTALAQGEQDISYTDIQMAELIMSDCGHSSDYTPLLNRIAGRLATYRQALAQPEQDHGFDRTASHMAGEYVDTKKPEQEPVAWKYDWYGHKSEKEPRALVKDWIASVYSEVSDPTINAHNIRPLYAAPPSKPWVGLTDDDIENLWNGVQWSISDFVIPFTRAIEAKLKEKNGGS